MSQSTIDCSNREYEKVIKEILFLKEITGREEFVLVHATKTSEEEIRKVFSDKGIKRVFVRAKDTDSYTVEIY